MLDAVVKRKAFWLPSFINNVDALILPVFKISVKTLLYLRLLLPISLCNVILGKISACVSNVDSVCIFPVPWQLICIDLFAAVVNRCVGFAPLALSIWNCWLILMPSGDKKCVWSASKFIKTGFVLSSL